MGPWAVVAANHRNHRRRDRLRNRQARPRSRENPAMQRITVIGGGFAGLTAAVTAAEAGAEVTLHEAHHTLGGRARTAEGVVR
ncbi:FAD-dependent oxidoreductase, partial [Streptomyces hirsutus]|uniref:FAD-dependent oxidoreductase n=1 Tax=Streptomyces hirsutus TaxID=35620 RepID=UPI0031FD9141